MVVYLYNEGLITRLGLVLVEGFAGSCQESLYTKLGLYYLISPKFPVLRGMISRIGLLIGSKGFRMEVERVIRRVDADRDVF